MKDYGEDLLNVIEAGKTLIQKHKDKKDEGIEETLFVALMHIERILDIGRMFQEPTIELRSQVNRGMDELRKSIQDIIYEMGIDKAKEIMAREGENVKRRM